MLFNEPKLLKFGVRAQGNETAPGFSALQRAEIAEILFPRCGGSLTGWGFSALQRAEIAEIFCLTQTSTSTPERCFSALQRAEIAEIELEKAEAIQRLTVSVLFNEPKLLKLNQTREDTDFRVPFQCSSTSRNC